MGRIRKERELRRPKITVIGEGLTERWYFNHLRSGMKEKYKDSEDVLICDSMPSIEFWFLIHYLNTAKYFTDSKAVIVKLREWLPEYRKTGRFLEKRKWVEDLCRDGRLDVACVRASAMKEDSQSYSNVYKAVTLFASQER